MREKRKSERGNLGVEVFLVLVLDCWTVGVAVGDCRHHHRHHRSVYKKNFFATTFFVGDGNPSPSLSLV